MYNGLKKVITVCAIFIGIWLSVRFLLPLVLPFLLGAGLALIAEPTPTPAPLTFADVKAMMNQPATLETAEPNLETEAAEASGDAAQALVLYGENGVQAISLVPGASVTGEELLKLIDKIMQILAGFFADI